MSENITIGYRKVIIHPNQVADLEREFGKEYVEQNFAVIKPPGTKIEFAGLTNTQIRKVINGQEKTQLCKRIQ